MEVLTRMFSNHNPIMVRCDVPTGPRNVHPFRFLTARTTHADYRDVVTNAWRAPEGTMGCGSDCLKLVSFLKSNRYDFHSMVLHLLLSRDWEVHLHHVHREQNASADCKAGIGAKAECAFLDLPSPRNFILHFLFKDLLALYFSCLVFQFDKKNIN